METGGMRKKEDEREDVFTTGEYDDGEEARSFPIVGVGLAFLFAGAAFFSGLQLGTPQGNEAGIGSLFRSEQAVGEADLREFWRVWNLLEDKFVSSTTTDPLTDEEKVYGAIEGLVGAYGDPYTVFLPPKDAEIFESDIAGNFQGVGMEVGIREDVLTVIAPLPDTPAERAGVQPGDAIIRIDGTSTEGMGVDEAVSLIRGEEGTEVKLTLYREGLDEFLELTIVREIINIPTIKTEIRDGVFIIQLFNFSATSEALMQQALREYVGSGSRKLVIDVRGNPGGFLQSAVGIASYFLPTGKVVVRENFGDDREEYVYRSTGRLLGRYAPTDIVVLINQGSASASEILAGALREHGAATLIGEKTFGKGSVQELVELGDGSSLKVTIARWLTPNGNSISEAGLAPDIEVPYTAEDREAGRDPQLDAAIEFLNK